MAKKKKARSQESGVRSQGPDAITLSNCTSMGTAVADPQESEPTPAESTDLAVADPQESGVRGQGSEPTPAVDDRTATPTAVADSQPQILYVNVRVPVGPLGDGHQARHVEAQLRTPRERATMRRIFAGLDSSGARTADGRVVASNGHAIRWLIEQVASELKYGLDAE